jgi:hypothetical protein
MIYNVQFDSTDEELIIAGETWTEAYRFDISGSAVSSISDRHTFSTYTPVDFAFADLIGSSQHYIMVLSGASPVHVFELTTNDGADGLRPFSQAPDISGAITLTAGNVAPDTFGTPVGYEEVIFQTRDTIEIYTYHEGFDHLDSISHAVTETPMMVTGEIDNDDAADLVVVSDRIDIFLTSPDSVP